MIGRAIAVLIFGIIIVPGMVAQGGGDVQNRLPEFLTFERSGPTTPQIGDEEIVCGVISDANGEVDIVNVTVNPGNGLDTVWYNFTATDLTRTVEPSVFDNGSWKIWNPADDDGRVSFRYRHIYNVSGTYSWSSVASDESGFGPASAYRNTTVASSHSTLNATGDPCFNSSTPAQESAPNSKGSGPVRQNSPELEPHSDNHPSYDISDSLVTRRAGGGLELNWDPVPAAIGYQIWVKEDDTWTLHATLEGELSEYKLTQLSRGAQIKVTYFADKTLAAGYASDGAEGMVGWQEDIFATVPGGPIETALRVWGGAQVVKIISVASLLLFFLWRARKTDDDHDDEEEAILPTKAPFSE